MKFFHFHLIYSLTCLSILASACTEKSNTTQTSLQVVQPKKMGVNSEVLNQELTELLGANKTGQWKEKLEQPGLMNKRLLMPCRLS